ncbi:MAG: rod shape-determining protein MreD [Chloroflexi bacterium]|jgi:rod shape-determining protein MreD|nr:rod shape-determining protein MreD [Chloroflexota bacterium]
MISSTIILAVPLMAFLTVLHTAVLPHFPVFGVVPSLPFLVALAWGLLRGATEGVIWAFIAGFFMDLFTAAPAGGLALTYMIAVLVAVLINEVLPANRFVVPMLLAAMATIIQQLLYTIYLGLFGYNMLQIITTSSLATIVLHTFLILPVYWLLFLIQRTVWPRPVEV